MRLCNLPVGEHADSRKRNRTPHNSASAHNAHREVLSGISCQPLTYEYFPEGFVFKSSHLKLSVAYSK